VNRDDVRLFLTEGLTDTWLASRVRARMAPGDVVYFWLAGPRSVRGMYGWGSLISAAWHDPDLDDYGVEVRYECRFGRPLSAELFERHRFLRKLPILYAPRGTNFLLSMPHARELARFVSNEGLTAPKHRLGGRGKLFDVALSFAGEDRKYARQFEQLLRQDGVSTFLDVEQQESIWGKSLKKRLTEVYSKQSRFCVVLISRYYRDKAWTRFEGKVIGTRQKERVLHLRLDDTQLPGLKTDMCILDLRKVGLRSACDILCRLVRQTRRTRL
jgi:hypothetical protein